MPDRIALITDIHGNLAGLEAVWLDIERSACDHVICLGDLVDGGEHNEEVVHYLWERNVPCLRGNHDDIVDGLSEGAVAFLRNLPERLEENNVLYAHISPRACGRKIIDEYEAWNVFDDCEAKLIVVGHAHIPIIYGERCAHAASATYYRPDHNVPFPLDPSDRYIVCVGAVGYPRDGIRYPRYAIYHQSQQTIEMRLVEGPVLPFG